MEKTIKNSAAWKRGWKEHVTKSLVSNPYPSGTPEHLSWRQGWIARFADFRTQEREENERKKMRDEASQQVKEYLKIEDAIALYQSLRGEPDV